MTEEKFIDKITEVLQQVKDGTGPVGNTDLDLTDPDKPKLRRAQRIDPTLVQTEAKGDKNEQDVGRWVVARMEAMGIPQVAKDHESRIAFGEKKYGQRLCTNNGRDVWLDLYQELLDSCSYSAQLILEDEESASRTGFRSIFDKLCLLAAYTKGRIDQRDGL